jgi:nucleosome binding factor SPN SPT16 subunit
MIFVFKDYHRKISMVNAVPMNMLDHVKEWLKYDLITPNVSNLLNILSFSSCDIRYTEGIQSLNWAKIMKTIIDDPEGFFDSGGWSFLDPDSDEENQEDDDDSADDEQYKPSGSEETGEDSESEYSEDSAITEEESDESGISSRFNAFKLLIINLFCF